MNTILAVYENQDRRYVMAFICRCCGKPAVAFGDDAAGVFTGICPAGNQSTVMAS